MMSDLLLVFLLYAIDFCKAQSVETFLLPSCFDVIYHASILLLLLKDNTDFNIESIVALLLCCRLEEMPTM